MVAILGRLRQAISAPLVLTGTVGATAAGAMAGTAAVVGRLALGASRAVTRPALDPGRRAVHAARRLAPGTGLLAAPLSEGRAWSTAGRTHLDLNSLPADMPWAPRIAKIEDGVRSREGVDAAHVDPALGRLVVRHSDAADDAALWDSVLEAVAVDTDATMPGSRGGTARDSDTDVGPTHESGDESGDALAAGRPTAAQGAAEAGGDAGEDEPASGPAPIADPGNLLSIVLPLVSAGLDGAAVAAAIAGKMLVLRPAPPALRALVTVIKHHPEVTAALEPRLGENAVGMLLDTLTAVTEAAAQAPGAAALNLAQSLLQAAEALEDRRTWSRYEPILTAPDRPRISASAVPPITAAANDPTGHTLAHAGTAETSRALIGELAGETAREAARDAIEDYAGIATNTSLLTAGALWAAGRRTMAMESILAGAPKAAKLGRSAFGSVLGRGLARRGVLVLDPEVLHRLDRIAVLVLDGEATRGRTPAVLDAWAQHPDWTAGGVWAAADAALGTSIAAGAPPARTGPEDPEDPEDEACGPVGADAPPRLEPADGADPISVGGPRDVRLVDPASGETLGGVRIGRETDPHALALIQSAHRCGIRIVLREAQGMADLVSIVSTTRAAETGLSAIVADERRAHGPVMLVATTRGPRSARGRGQGGFDRLDEEAGTGSDDAGDPDGAARATDILAALAAADAGIAIDDPHAIAPWSADVVVGPGPAAAIPLVDAVRRARDVGDDSVMLSKGGSALAALLVLTENAGSRTGTGFNRWLSPVNAAGATALLRGSTAARSLLHTPERTPQAIVPWHALDAQVVFARLDAERALEQSGARARRPRLGGTVLGALGTLGGASVRGPAGTAVLAAGGCGACMASAVRYELDDPMTPILAVGSAASAILGSNVDALLVGGVTTVNAIIGAAQRLRAENAAAALFAHELPVARRVITAPEGPAGPGGPGDPDVRAPDPDRRLRAVLDSARTATLPAAELRPGDVIDVRAADVVPADARLLTADGLEIDESALTGESQPVGKGPEATVAEDLAARTSMIYESTTVASGHGRAVVVAVGPDTAARRAAAIIPAAGPAVGVQARLRELTDTVMPLTLAGGGLVTGLSLLRRTGVQTAVADGVATAVAAVPEGLPLVATVAQLASARRLSRRGILVRGPHAIEALGRVDTVCFDKTGTLTTNELSVVTAVPAGHPLPAEDTPFPRVDDAAACTVLRAAARACPRPGSPHHHAHATDDAVAEAAEALSASSRSSSGPAAPGPEAPWRHRAEIPFESHRGFSAAVGTATPDGNVQVLFKGAPEVLLPCTGPDAEAGRATVQAMAGRGLRVLAVARATIDGAALLGPRPEDAEGPEGPENADDGAAPLAPDEDDLAQRVARLVDPESGAGLELLGFVGLADTPRPTARPLIDGLTTAGQRVVLITGDHPVTARAIARGLGLPADARVVTGDELMAVDEDVRDDLALSADVFARVTPAQKVQVVTSLQRGGRVTAMVGDGANDAAAIRAAEVGIGITSRGSSAARDAADLVLTGSDLTVILDALVEGRNMWGGVRDALVILVGGNAGEIAFSVLGTLVAGQAPIGTRQLLLVNLLTDMFPALAVAVTPKAPDPDALDDVAEADRTAVREQYRRTILAEGPLSLGTPLLRAIAARGGVTASAAAVAWMIGRRTPGTRRRSETMGLATVVGTQLAQTLLSRSRSPLVLATSLGSAAALVALIQTPGVSHFFGCTPLGPVAWSVVAATTAAAAAGSLLLPNDPAGPPR